MNRLLYPLAAGAFALAFVAAPAMGAPRQDQQQSSQQNTQSSQTQTQGQTTTAPPVNVNAPPPPPPSQQPTTPSNTQDKTASAPAPAAKPVPGTDAPIQQQDHPNVKSGSKQDVDSIGNRDVGKGLDFYSIEKEIALGKSLAQEVEKTSKLCDDPVVVEYVNRVGQNLVRNSDAKVPFTIKVIDSDEINAFALPGGFFYVNSGLILRATEESELAGVMAHEIAHVAARHGTKNATKGEIAQLAMIPAMIFLPPTLAGYGIYEATQFAIPMGFLKFSRDSEREADYLGLQYMYKAGYDPNAYVAFFEKILAEEKRQPGSIPKVFSTHPPTPERIQNSQKEISQILPSRDDYIVSTSEFDTVKARLNAYEHRNKPKAGDPGKPSLRTKTEQKTAGQGQGQTGADGTASSDDSDRPVLKKRTDGAKQGSGSGTGSGSGSGNGSGTTGNGTGTGTGTGNGSGNGSGSGNN